MISLNKNVPEGLMNPKTVGVDQRVGQGQSQLGAALGANAIPAQQAAFEEYLRAARGQAPSAAQAQLQAGLEQQQRAAMDLAGRTRGGNLGGAYTAALGAQSGAMAQANQQAAALRAAEMEQARAGLAGLGGQMASQQFGYEQLMNNTTLGLRGQDLNYNLGNRQMQMQRELADRDFTMQLVDKGVSALGSVAGAIGGMSDERAKEGFRPLDTGSAGAAVGEIQPAMWDSYRPGMGPPGPRMGVSAQQLEGTSLGGLVFTGPDGYKRVDGVGAGMAGLAASADQEHRLRALEAQMARQDPNASRESLANADAFDAEFGAAREAEARRLSREISSARQQARTPQGYDFGRSPQMYRGRDTGGGAAIDPFDRRGSPAGGRAIDPFAGESAPSEAFRAYADAPTPSGTTPWRPGAQRLSADPWENALSDERAKQGMRPMTRGDAGASAGEMRAMPVAAPPANQNRRAAPEPYRGEGRAIPIPTRPEEPAPPPLTPQQQAIVDAFWDEMDRWGARAEDGSWHATANRGPALPYTRGEARALDEFDQMDRESAIRQEMERQRRAAARAPRQRMYL